MSLVESINYISGVGAPRMMEKAAVERLSVVFLQMVWDCVYFSLESCAEAVGNFASSLLAM